MRREDWNAALAIRDFWKASEGSKAPACPHFTSLDSLLEVIVRLRIYPGHAISSCSMCGGEHRWAMLKQLLILGFDMKPRGENRVLDAFYEMFSENRACYGGDEGYQKMRQAAEAFFANHPSADIYLP